MLTTEERARLEEAFPSTATVEWDGAEQQYDVHPYWEGADHDESYPALVLGWETRGIERDDVQPMGDVLRIENEPDVAEYREVHGSRQADSLTVTVAVQSSFVDGIPPQVRAEQIARDVWDAVRFELDLNETGPNGERPMLLEPSTAPSGPVRVQRTLRVEGVVDVQYTTEFEQTSETTADVEYDVEST